MTTTTWKTTDQLKQLADELKEFDKDMWEFACPANFAEAANWDFSLTGHLALKYGTAWQAVIKSKNGNTVDAENDGHGGPNRYMGERNALLKSAKICYPKARDDDEALDRLCSWLDIVDDWTS
jgi:hypothetical protein